MLAGMTEELIHSLLLLFVYTQSYDSWQLCLDGFPQAFYGVFQVLAGVTEGLTYSPSFDTVHFPRKSSWTLDLGALH